ncbi:hypothetical protein QBC37DRAFT_393697 [Rhypophila decipiens]|uniref:Uncharacterized protein n=1 Tax=Rhypophila decipiens TaxID=261697 RepID=A0AAN7B0Q8_9PEZI|nr:hypothetical protein QBC37DRAFT_393697 [Rhypophila decipiens]
MIIMADPGDKRLAHILSHAGRKDLIGKDKDEALFQLLNFLLNPHTPLKLHDCRKRWVRALTARYNTKQPALDIICFTFALRHFTLELIEMLNNYISPRVLSVLQKAIATIIQTPNAAQDGSSWLKVFPWGDVAQYVSQMDWELSRKYLGEILEHWNTFLDFYKSYSVEKTASDTVHGQQGEQSNHVSLPSFNQLMTNLEQGPG